MKLDKPALGSAAKAKRARRRRLEDAEAAAKQAAKARDAYVCRRCRTYWGIEAAHIADKGMGGDHGRRSSHPRDYITLCHTCHQGPRSVHSGHVRIIAGPEGGDGHVAFCELTTEQIGRV